MTEIPTRLAVANHCVQKNPTPHWGQLVFSQMRTPKIQLSFRWIFRQSRQSPGWFEAKAQLCKGKSRRKTSMLVLFLFASSFMLIFESRRRVGFIFLSVLLEQQSTTSKCKPLTCFILINLNLLILRYQMKNASNGKIFPKHGLLAKFGGLLCFV